MCTLPGGRGQSCSLCGSICEGRSRPRLWGTENKGPAETSASRSYGGPSEGGRHGRREARTEGALGARAPEVLSLPGPRSPRPSKQPGSGRPGLPLRSGAMTSEESGLLHPASHTQA